MIGCACVGCRHRFNAEMESRRKDTIAKTLGHERAVTLNMASINICEREGCGSLIKGNALSSVMLSFAPDLSQGVVGTQPVRAELCPACAEDLYRLLRSEPLGPRERVYAQPFNPQKADSDDLLDQVDDEGLAAELLTRLMRTKTARALLRGSDDNTIEGEVE